MKKKGNLSFYLRAKNADVGPPIATRFGNYFINTSKFCKDFNSYTKELKDYFVLMVFVDAFEGGEYSYKIDIPSISFLLNMIWFDYYKKVKLSGGLKKVKRKAIYFEDLYKVSMFKFDNVNVSSLKIVIGVVKSMNLLVIKKNNV